MSMIVRGSNCLFAMMLAVLPRMFIATDDVYGLIGMIAKEYRIAYELSRMSCLTVTLVIRDKIFGSSLKNKFASFA